jgi:hypothetical protein
MATEWFLFTFSKLVAWSCAFNSQKVGAKLTSFHSRAVGWLVGWLVGWSAQQTFVFHFHVSVVSVHAFLYFSASISLSASRVSVVRCHLFSSRFLGGTFRHDSLLSLSRAVVLSVCPPWSSATAFPSLPFLLSTIVFSNALHLFVCEQERPM